MVLIYSSIADNLISMLNDKDTVTGIVIDTVGSWILSKTFDIFYLSTTLALLCERSDHKAGSQLI